ncbi:hypothetical protein LTR08_004042 [Meristemomyces frigidus]|nr:hypothetical protein LTR08_004042 [Meristemomyces frigidus]
MATSLPQSSTLPSNGVASTSTTSQTFAAALPLGALHPNIAAQRAHYLDLHASLKRYLRLWEDSCQPAAYAVDTRLRELARRIADSIARTFPTQLGLTGNLGYIWFQGVVPSEVELWIFHWRDRSLRLYECLCVFLRTWEMLVLPTRGEGLETLELAATALTLLRNTFPREIVARYGLPLALEGPARATALGLASPLGELRRLPPELRDRIYRLCQRAPLKLWRIPAEFYIVTLTEHPCPVLLRLSRQLRAKSEQQAALDMQVTITDGWLGNDSGSKPNQYSVQLPSAVRMAHKHSHPIVLNLLLPADHCEEPLVARRNKRKKLPRCGAAHDMIRQAAIIQDIRRQCNPRVSFTLNIHLQQHRTQAITTPLRCEAYLLPVLTSANLVANTTVQLIRFGHTFPALIGIRYDDRLGELEIEQRLIHEERRIVYEKVQTVAPRPGAR